MPEIEDITETTDTAALMLWWQWAIVIIVAVLTAYFFNKWLKKNMQTQTKVNNLTCALEQLVKIEEKELNDNQLATEISRITREYLRSRLNNQSLFQTHQEFVKDHEDLNKLPPPARHELAHYLELLSSYKYLPDSNLPTNKAKLLQHTETLLRGIDSTLVVEA